MPKTAKDFYEEDIRPDYLANSKNENEEADNNESENDNSTENALSDAESNPEKPKNNNNIADREASGDKPSDSQQWKNNVSPRNNLAANGLNKSKNLKAIAPIASIIGTIVASVAVLAIVFSGALGPMSFVANIVDDLGYQLAAFDIRHLMMLKNKLTADEKDLFNKSCTKPLSIRCKFKSMSEKQIARYDSADIKMNYGTDTITKTVQTFDEENMPVGEPVTTTEKVDSNGLHLETTTEPLVFSDDGMTYKKTTITHSFEGDKTITGRAKIKTVEIDGVKSEARGLKKAIPKDFNKRFKLKAGVKGITITTSDDTFVSRTLERFGISTKPRELSGKTAEERVKALMNRSTTKNLSELEFKRFDKDGNPVASDAPEVNSDYYTLSTDATPTEARKYTPKEFKKLSKSIRTAKWKSSGVGKATTDLASVLNVLGYYDLACSIKNMFGSAAVGAKVSNAQQLAEYAMPIVSLVGKMKAGDASEIEAEAVGKFFGDTDKRRTLSVLEAKETTSADEIKDASVTQIPNPDYGKSALNSSLYEMSATGKVPATSEVNNQYALGMSQNKALKAFSKGSDIAETILNLGVDNDGACKLVQNWVVRGTGLIVGAVAAIGTSGASVAISAGVAIGMMALFTGLSYMLNNAVSGNMLTEDMENRPVERGTAVWGGLAVISSQNAMNRGMIPGNIEQIAAYSDLQNQSRLDRIAVDAQGTSPLDISNPNSFIGVLATTIGGHFNASIDVSSSLTGIASVVTKGLASVLSPQRAFAKTFNEDRYKQCDDKEYKDLGIDADVQCNLSYVMPTEDLNLETDSVAQYMEDNGYVEKDTETGLPKGYTAPSPKDSQSFAMGLVTGAVDGFVSQFYSSRTYGDTTNGYNDEYGKYLDFCVYRAMPFGNTYEEGGAINGAESAWLTGENCLKTEAPYNYFRTYTFDKSVNSAIDEEAV